MLQVQEALGLTIPHLVKIGQPLAPQQLQAGAVFSAVVQLPQEPPADLEDLEALQTTTILPVGACSGPHKNQPLEAETLQEAYSAAATLEEGSVRRITSSNPVHSMPL